MATDSTEVTVRCPKCSTSDPLAADATERTCGNCAEHYRFLACPHCGDSAQVSDKLSRRNQLWLCPSCRLPVRNPQWLSAPRGSAGALHRQLEAKGTLVDDPDIRSHGGFYVVAAEGAWAEFKDQVPCSLVTLSSEVRLVRAGSHEVLSIPYDRLTNVQVSGEDQTMGRYFHNRFGLAGAAGDIAVGMLAGNTRKKREIRTFMYLESQDGRLLLLHLRMPVDAMRQSFPRLVSRFPPQPES